jgi:hypothetical protein
MIISQAHDAAMGFGDRLHDSQAQPGAPSGARCWGEADERMSEITLREPTPMITNVQLDNLAVALAEELHVTGTVGERVVHQVAKGILEPVTVRRDGGLVGDHRDRAALKLSSTAATAGYLLE